MDDTKPLAVGDVLWFCNRRGVLDVGGLVTIARVGTRWATFEWCGLQYRVDKRTRKPDDAWSWWMLWESEAARRESVEIADAWRAFRADVARPVSPQAGVTTADILAARALLRIDA